jgi:hypothetical protein
MFMTSPSCAGEKSLQAISRVDPRIHRKDLLAGWIAGSSPAMTLSVCPQAACLTHRRLGAPLGLWFDSWNAPQEIRPQ